MSLDTFRDEAREFIATHCPESMRLGTVHFEDSYELYRTDEALQWRAAAAERGWTAPAWPTEYGGGGMSKDELDQFALGRACVARKIIPITTLHGRSSGNSTWRL